MSVTRHNIAQLEPGLYAAAVSMSQQADAAAAPVGSRLGWSSW